MDRRFAYHYNRELEFVRKMAGEFRDEHPKIAQRLSLDEFDCADPYVERLLEGFAFLSARIQRKLEAEFPRFTQSLLDTVYPHYLAPTPSMAVVKFEPSLDEGDLAEGFTIDRGTSLRAVAVRGGATPCIYTTAHETTLYPIEIEQVTYHSQDLATLSPPSGCNARAAIRIRLRATAGVMFNEIQLDRLAVHIRGTDATPLALYEQIFADTAAVAVQSAERKVEWSKPAGNIRRLGFDPEHSLLPYDARSFQGYRLIHEYFAFPQRYMFFELTGLAPGVKHCESDSLDIVIFLTKRDADLEKSLDAGHLALYCTPAINLFERPTDRVPVSDRFPEFHLVVDRTRKSDFEVFRVLSVTGYEGRAREGREFLPFYSADDFSAGGDGIYYVVNRRPSPRSAREKRLGRRMAYRGTEVYLSLVDVNEAPYRTELNRLGARVLCTNRHLSLDLEQGAEFTLETGGPYDTIRCVGAPTAPVPSHAEGEFSWRLISHLSLNYLSLIDTNEQEGASALRSMLKLYADASDRRAGNQIDGVRSISGTPKLGRVPRPGPVAFARGLEIGILFDESLFEGTGSSAFLLGGVLEQFFSGYVSTNSFAETVISTLERGEIKRWPAIPGQRGII